MQPRGSPISWDLDSLSRANLKEIMVVHQSRQGKVGEVRNRLGIAQMGLLSSLSSHGGCRCGNPSIEW